MSRIKVTNLRHESATSDNISLDSFGNVSAPGNLSVTGTTTFTDDLNVDSGSLFVDASADRVGIGTTTPSSQLELAGSAPVITLDATGNNQPMINLQQSGTTYARFRFDGNNVDIGNLYSGGSTIINAGNAERMRITSNGAVVMSTDTTFTQESSAKLTVRNTSSYAIACKRTGTGGEGQIAFKNGNGLVGSITTSGSATAYNTSSDYRLKENVVDLDNAIDRVKQLAPKRFNFIVDETDTAVDGFLAHEVQSIVPEAISGAKDEVKVWQEGEELPSGVSVGDNKLDEDGNTIPVYQGIDQSKLVPLLTAALQEAVGKIETLEAANTSQVATIAALDARLTALEG